MKWLKNAVLLANKFIYSTVSLLASLCFKDGLILLLTCLAILPNHRDMFGAWQHQDAAYTVVLMRRGVL